MNIVKLKLDQIELPKDRLRTVHEGYAIEIAESMNTLGLISPIEVVAPKKEGGLHRLNAGAHRLRAAVILGWTEIDAVVWKGSAKDVRSREIAENVVRRSLSVLGLATCLAEWENLYPKSKNGGDRRSDQFAKKENCSPRFALYAAQQLGLAETSTRRLINIHKGLSAPVRRLLENTAIEDDQGELLLLSQIEDPAQQLAIATVMLADGKSFNQVARGPAADVPIKEAQQQFDDFVRRFDKYNPEARRRVIHWLIEQGHIELGQVAA